MDRRERVVDRKADEIIKKFTSDIVKIYDEEAKELMRQAEAEGVPDIKLHIRKPVNIRKCVLRIAAMFLVIVFVGSAESRCMARLVARPLDGGKHAGY